MKKYLIPAIALLSCTATTTVSAAPYSVVSSIIKKNAEKQEAKQLQQQEEDIVLSNPFADVPTDNWAYGAVQKLYKDGIIQGYKGQIFQGDKPITRYEMAAIVGRAVANEKKADAADRKLIFKLLNEYKAELEGFGMRLAKVEKSTAGVQDLKISHWIQTENTYGNPAGSKGAHEYELEYRLTAQKQISKKLSALMQIETKTYWDQDNWREQSKDDGVYMRQGYVQYQPDQDTNVIGGKNAYWLADGFLGDDYISGVYVSHNFSKNTTGEILYGYYNGPQFAKSTLHSRIGYISLKQKMGAVTLGAHYLRGTKGLNNAGWEGTRPDLYNHESHIWATTASADLGQSGINLALGYGKNTAASSDNALTKVQLYKKIGQVDTFVQYWKQGKNVNLPIENGNHMTWWGDEYLGKGVKGYRVITGYAISPNCYAEAWCGLYHTNPGNDLGRKYGWDLTFTY